MRCPTCNRLAHNQMDEFWSHCLAHFERTLNTQQLNTWIRPLVAEVAVGQVDVMAPNGFVAQWVRDKFLSEIEQLSIDYFPVATRVVLKISGGRSLRQSE